MSTNYTSYEQLPLALSAEEVAQVLGISRANAYTLMHSKGFPTIKIGKRMVVQCVNKDKGPVAKKACAAACIGCGICVKTCTHDAIVLENNVAYIDSGKCKLCRECEAMCPTGAIHGINFPKPLDKDAVKARIAERKRKAKEAEDAAKAAAAAAAETKKEEA